MPASRRARRTPAWLRWVVLGGILVLALWSGWLAVRGLVARNELTAAIPVARELSDTVLSGDSGDSGETGETDALVRELKDHAATASAMTHDPIWMATEHVPWIGPNLTAVRQVTEIATTLTDESLDPLVAAASQFDPETFAIVDGAIALEPIIAMQDEISTANDAMADAAAQAEAIDAASTVGPVRSAVDQLLDLVDEVTSSVDALDRTAHLLPAMLGADGTRNTLVLVQNNAELRSSGGISGALALVSATNGAIDMTQQASTRDFPELAQPILPLDDATLELYGEITGTYIQNVNLTPWFDTTGQLAKARWEQQIGGTVDAVLAVDPVLLSYLLEATGPVPVGEVTLTAENAVAVLLSETYARYPDPAQQDLFFAEAAEAVFSALTSDVDPRAVVEALIRGGDEQRIRIWNVRDEDQQYVAGTSLSGMQPSDNSDGPQLGLYLNDGTGAKMDYYLDVAIDIAVGSCSADGAPSYRVTATLTNTAPADAATSLPEYVTGGGVYGVEPGKIKTIVTAYGPVDATVQSATQDSAVVFGVNTVDRGRPVFQVETLLAPGESTVIEVDFTGVGLEGGPLSLVHTPFVNDIETKHRSLICGALV